MSEIDVSCEMWNVIEGLDTTKLDKYAYRPYTGDYYSGFGLPPKMQMPKRLEYLPNQQAGWEAWKLIYSSDCNLMLTGETGSGKTTTLVWLAKIFAAWQHRYLVRYCTLSELADELLAVRRGNGSTEGKMWRELGGLDLLIVDEVADRRRQTPLVNEWIFELVDRAYSGKIQRLWFAGNIDSRTIDGWGDEPEVFRRRLRESFKGLLLHKNNGCEPLEFGGSDE